MSGRGGILDDGSALSLTEAELTGRTDAHVVEVAGDRPVRLHRAVVEPWRSMCAAAARETELARFIY